MEHDNKDNRTAYLVSINGKPHSVVASLLGISNNMRREGLTTEEITIFLKDITWGTSTWNNETGWQSNHTVQYNGATLPFKTFFSY